MKTKSIQLSTLTLLSLPFFSACAPYSESFDCPPGHGVGCKSLSQVNQLVEEGKLPLEDKTTALRKDSSARAIKKPPKNTKQRNLLIETKQKQEPINILSPSARAGKEEQFRIWIAAYEDEGDSPYKIYHAPSYVYTSMKMDSAE